jgi:hypothetical protein
MGVSSTTNRVAYNGDGTTTSFSFPYYFFHAADIVVYIYDTILGGTVLQTLGTNYTISGTQNTQGLYPNGASIVFGTAPVNTSSVVILRSPVETQTYSLLQNGQISSTALVQQMDYLTLLIQRLEDQVGRCVQLPDGLAPSFSGILPSTAALNPLYYVAVNGAGNGFTLTTSLSPIQQLVIPYTLVNPASTTDAYQLFSLPPGAILTYVVIKHTTAFTGTSITAVKAAIGNGGSPNLFLSNYDVHQNPGDTIYSSIVANYIGSFTNPTPIYLTMTSTGANLSALSQGSLNVWYDYDTI